MKQKFTLSIILLATLFVASCSKATIDAPASTEPEKVILSPDEIISIAYDNPVELSETQIMDIVNDFYQAIESKSETRSIGTPVASIVSKYYVAEDGGTQESISLTRSEEEMPLVPVYEVSLKQGNTTSFIMVSGDERVPEVLAYIPESDEDVMKKPEMSAMLAMTKANLFDDIEEIEAIKEEYRDNTISKLSEGLGIPADEVNYDRVKDLIAVEGQATRADESNIKHQLNTQLMGYVTPMSKTAWTQDPPYNRAFPVVPYAANMSMPAVAGCGVIALAQMMAIIEPNRKFDGMTMNWPYIEQRPVLL